MDIFQYTFPPPLQDSLEGIEEELSRVAPTLQRYGQFSPRPSVSFAQDSLDSPLPAQAFLSQMECTEDEEVKVIRGSETEWNQLGKAGSVTLLPLHSPGTQTEDSSCVSSAGNFLFWRCLCGKSPLHKVCYTLQQAGISPQQLLVRRRKRLAGYYTCV